MLAYMLLLTAADLQIILALLGSLDFDLKPTVKHGNSFIVPTPLMITFFSMFKLNFFQKVKIDSNSM